MKSKLGHWLPWWVLNISGLPHQASASAKASTQNPASMVFDNRQNITWRFAKSMIATKYRKPRWTVCLAMLHRFRAGIAIFWFKRLGVVG